MTTTAFVDQFTAATQTIEGVHAPYEPVAILKRNVAELELALKQQTERAEAAEAELARLAQQKPVAWRHENGNIFLPWQKDMIVTGAVFSPLFAAPLVPAVPKEWKQAVSDFLSSHDAAWAELFKSLPADTRSVTVSNHQADAVRKANVLRDLLQSAEVRHD